MKRVGVFCGSSSGARPDYTNAAVELANLGVSELRAVHSMRERKAVMAELSDGFIALPGGYGTLDELMEMLTWTQLGIHQKPCGLLNTCRYYDGLMAFVDHTVAENFVQAEHRSMLLVETEPAALLSPLAFLMSAQLRVISFITEQAGNEHLLSCFLRLLRLPVCAIWAHFS
ncbi:MAG: TIGR00730 family Rossman fold protein [Myxococcales bacterium]|nr:TIGR00730 family Rossman fold protein [Myxococcales bacterium]